MVKQFLSAIAESWKASGWFQNDATSLLFTESRAIVVTNRGMTINCSYSKGLL